MRIVDRKAAEDGSVKYLGELEDNNTVEFVYFQPGAPYLCVSTQVGCNVGCTFCETGKQRCERNLTAEEICDQARAALDDLGLVRRFHKIKLAGMGEPLLNLGAVRESVSRLSMQGLAERVDLTTVGIAPAIREIVDLDICQLVVSLHATTDAVRSALIPIARRYSMLLRVILSE